MPYALCPRRMVSYRQDPMRSAFFNLPSLVFTFLFFLLPLLFTTQTDELFEFPKMLAVYGASGLLFSYWIFKSVQDKKLVWKRTVLDLPILAFVLSQLLATFFSINTHTSLFGYYSRFNGGLLSTLSYVVLYYGFVFFIPKAQIGKHVQNLLFGGILAALYAFPEHFGHSPSCYMLTGDFNVECWVQDVKSRVFGTFGQPNWLAAYMIVLLPLALSKLLESLNHQKNTIRNGVVWSISFLLFASVLLFTQSRSGILGAGLALSLFMAGMLLFSYKEGKKTVSSLVFPAIALAVFVLLVVIIKNPFGDTIRTKLNLSQASPSSAQSTAPVGPALETGGSESGDIRKVVWQGAINVWKRYPLFGSGVETFAYSYFQDRPIAHNELSEWDFLYNKAHNEFLNYLATTGIVGLLSYVAMYASFAAVPLLLILKQKKPDQEQRLLIIALASGLGGLAVSNFFGFSTVVVSLLSFMFPAIAIAALTPDEKRLLVLSTPKKMEFSAFQYIGATVAIIFCGWIFLSLYGMYTADTLHSNAKLYASKGNLEDAFYASQTATQLLPNEPVLRDELAYTAARISYALATGGSSTDSANMAQYAIDQSDIVIEQNSRHLNFYKTRARIFLLLAQINPAFYEQAKETIQRARELSPTDPKLVYTLSVIANAQNKPEEERKLLEETLSLRPKDEQARLALGTFYENQKEYQKAKEQYEYMLQFVSPKNAAALERLATVSALLNQKK